jgi:hypothetical protein
MKNLFSLQKLSVTMKWAAIQGFFNLKDCNLIYQAQENKAQVIFLLITITRFEPWSPKTASKCATNSNTLPPPPHYVVLYWKNRYQIHSNLSWYCKTQYPIWEGIFEGAEYWPKNLLKNGVQKYHKFWLIVSLTNNLSSVLSKAGGTIFLNFLLLKYKCFQMFSNFFKLFFFSFKINYFVNLYLFLIFILFVCP